MEAQGTKQRVVWCEWFFLSPIYVFNLRFLWFGCCLFLPHHMPAESHRHNPILSCSVEQILGEERKLHHIATSETMTSSNRYFSSPCWFVWHKPHLHLNQFLSQRIHWNLVNKSHSENKVEFVVVLHRNLPSFWSSGLPPPVALLFLFDRRSSWRDAEFSGSSLSPFSGTKLD